MKQKRWKTDGYLRIFASYYRPHWKLFALDMVCALCICLVDLAFPIVSRFSMQTLLPGQMFTAFFVVMAVLAGAYVLKGCFYYIITYWGHLLGVRMEADIRRDLFSHMQDLSFSFYDKNRTGQLMSRVTGDLFEITELAHHGPEDLFISSITILGAFCVMLTIRWELALIVFAVIPLFILFTTLCRKRMMRASTEVKAKLAGINGEVESSISGMRTAKAFANEAAESAKFDQANDQFRGAKRGYYRAMAFYQSGMEFFMGILSVVVIAFGGPISGSSSRMSFSLPAPSTTTSATAGLTPPRPRSWRPPSGRRSTTTSWTCPTASRPRWASGAPCSPAARSSGCPLPAFS